MLDSTARPIRGVFDRRYKLAVNLLSEDELYDLQEDPYEISNLIEDDAYTSTRDHLHNVLLERMNVTWHPFRGYYWERRAWRS